MHPAESKYSVGKPLDAAGVERALELMRKELRLRGLRNSTIREEIARVALTYDGHFEAQDLMAVLRRNGVRDAHLATVYRSLPVLVEIGLLQPTLRSTPDRQIYETAFERPHHDHLICVRCGKVIEFEFEAFEVLQRDVARQHGFRLTDHFHDLLGVCAECQAKEVDGAVDVRS